MTCWLGIDQGSKRIGVAAGSIPPGIATPVEVIPSEPHQAALDRIAQLAAASSTTVEEYSKALREGGQEQTLAGDILREKAKERLVEMAVPVDEDGDVIDLPVPDRGGAPGGEGSGDPYC